MIGFLLALFVVAWFYDRARRRRNNGLMNIFIGIGAFIIGGVITTFINDLFVIGLLPDNKNLETVISVTVLTVAVWLTYRGLKSVLNPTAKKVNNATLDSDLMDSPDQKDNFS
jgi:biotin transporter BioY